MEALKCHLHHNMEDLHSCLHGVSHFVCLCHKNYFKTPSIKIIFFPTKGFFPHFNEFYFIKKHEAHKLTHTALNRSNPLREERLKLQKSSRHMAERSRVNFKKIIHLFE